MIAFRCDGDSRVGAGHVARCAQIALAYEAAATPTVFAGCYGGIAAELLARSGLRTVAPDPARPLGAPAEAAAVVVDSYEIDPAELERAAADLPVVAIVDEGPAPRVTAVLSYHLDAAARIEVPAPARPILGIDFVPVSPMLAAARRRRGWGTALVTMGASDTGTAAAAHAARELLALDEDLQIRVVAPGPDPVGDPRVAWAPAPGGLGEAIAAADVAVTAGGSTTYDLATAGVPMVIRCIAANQEAIRTAFVARDLAVADLEGLADPTTRERLAATGPRIIDGFGAYRARDAISAAVEGRDAPRALHYRPATEADAKRLHEWRNEPVTREMSRVKTPVAWEDHLVWLRAVLDDPDRTLLIVEHQGSPVGTMRFDREGELSEIALTVAPEWRGCGIANQTLNEGTELELATHPGLEAVTGDVQVRNTASYNGLMRAGYERSEPDPRQGSHLVIRRRRTPPPLTAG